MEKKSKALGTQGYKFTLLDRLVYVASLKRTMITLVVFLLFGINYSTMHLSVQENLLASVPNEIWSLFAIGFTAGYDMCIAFGVLEYKSKGKYDGSGLMSKEDYIMRVRPKIYYMSTIKKLAILFVFLAALFLVLFNGVSRVDFTDEGIERYNALGRMTESYSYEEINRCEIYCGWDSDTGKHSSVGLYADVVLPDGETVKIDAEDETSEGLYTLRDIRKRLKNAEITGNNNFVEDYIEWRGDLTAEEIEILYELTK